MVVVLGRRVGCAAAYDCDTLPERERERKREKMSIVTLFIILQLESTEAAEAEGPLDLSNKQREQAGFYHFCHQRLIFKILL